MKKRYAQGILIMVVLLFAMVINLMTVKAPWKAVQDLPIIFEWGYGLTLAFALNIPPVAAAVAVREYEQKLMEKPRFMFTMGVVLLEVGIAFALNMAVGVYLQPNWETAFMHMTPILPSLMVLLIVYFLYDPIEVRLDILEYRYDKLYTQISEKEREIERIGKPCNNEKGELAHEIDRYLEFIDRLDANARKMKIEVRKCMMKRLDDEDSIAKLSHSCQELMEGRTFAMDAEAEYHEFMAVKDM